MELVFKTKCGESLYAVVRGQEVSSYKATNLPAVLRALAEDTSQKEDVVAHNFASILLMDVLHKL